MQVREGVCVLMRVYGVGVGVYMCTVTVCAARLLRGTIC